MHWRPPQQSWDRQQMGARAWLKLVLLNISRQTPAYRAANLDWRWNLRTGLSISIFRRWFGAMFGVLVVGFAGLSTGAIGLAQSKGKATTVVVESRTAPASVIFTGTPSHPASAITGSGVGTLPPTTEMVLPTAGAAGGGGGGGFSSLLIVMGAILVLLGVGAIALILWRSKADNAPPEDDEAGPAWRGPTPVPASRELRSAVEVDAGDELE
jgi:hypothetical protein